MKEYLSLCVNFHLEPFPVRRGKVWKYYYLYETTNKINGNKYIGLRTYCGAYPENDSYLGNGFKISKGKVVSGFKNNTRFAKELNKFGFKNFEKRIICFFENKRDGLISERNIVNEEFIKLPNVLNMVVGGGKPPTGSGRQNNNYGNYWTEEMKKNLSLKMKGRYKGEANPNYGNKWSEDKKRKLSEKKKGKGLKGDNPNSKKVRIVVNEQELVFGSILEFGEWASLSKKVAYNVIANRKQISNKYTIDYENFKN